MRILIVSYENWTSENNGGNVLSNIFSSFKNVTFAQIYCSNGFPKNDICHNYLQLTDSMMMNKDCIGNKFSSCKESNSLESDKKINKKTFRYTKLLIRDYIWGNKKWKPSVKEFVLNFKPDIIFMPCYAIPHLLRIDLYIASICNAPIISYISDDGYGFNSFLTPSYLAYQIKVRRYMKKFFRYPLLTYTMTKEQKEEYEKRFNIKMHILRKDMLEPNSKIIELSKWNIIFAGGAYLGRDKVILKLVEALNKYKEVNNKSISFSIFSESISKNIRDKIERYDFVNIHKNISYQELLNRYQESNIALHVESFRYYPSKATRLSFSTKIIDCLTSGSLTLAIGPKNNAGINFLKTNKLALCVSNINELDELLERINNNQEVELIKNNVINFYNKNGSNNSKKLYDTFNKIYVGVNGKD